MIENNGIIAGGNALSRSRAMTPVSGAYAVGPASDRLRHADQQGQHARTIDAELVGRWSARYGQRQSSAPFDAQLLGQNDQRHEAGDGNASDEISADERRAMINGVLSYAFAMERPVAGPRIDLRL